MSSDKDKIKLILRSNDGIHTHTIPLNLVKTPDLSDSFIFNVFNNQQKEYIVESQVNNEVFKMFIKYWLKKEIPEITVNNYYKFEELNKEFGFLTKIISQQTEKWNNFEYLIKELNNSQVKDKQMAEEKIASNLDNCLIQVGPMLMNQPIGQLYNIFSHKKRQLTQHNIAYKLIKEKYLKSNDLNIFILLQFLDGSKLDHQYLRESFDECQKRNNFMPQINFSFINNFYDENKKQAEKIKKLEVLISNLEKKISQNDEEQNKKHSQTIEKINNLEKKVDSYNSQINENYNKLEKTQKDKQSDICSNIEKLNEQIQETNKNIQDLSLKLKKDISVINTNIEDQKSKSVNDIKAIRQNIQDQKINSEKEILTIQNNIKDQNSNYNKVLEKIKTNEESITNLHRSVYKPITQDGGGILSYLNKKSKDQFDRNYIVSLSSRDPYNIFLKDWNGVYYSTNGGNFYIEIIFKEAINMTGFKIFGSNDSFLKSYQIFIDDELEPFLDISCDTSMRDKHKSRHNFDEIKCQKFKLVQNSPNWDRSNDAKNYIGIKRMEFYTIEHPKGLIKYLNNSPVTNDMQNIESDPHLYQIKINANCNITDDIYNINSNKEICTDNALNEYFEIKFLKGFVSIDGYRVKRRNDKYKLKGWKIVGNTISNKEVLISEYNDSSEQSNPLYISDKNEIQTKEYISSLKFYNTKINWDSTDFLVLMHFEIFGEYIALP